MSGAARASLLVVAILGDVIASLSLKAGPDHPVLYGVVVIGYIAAFLTLGVVLRQGMSLGFAYSVWGAAAVALTSILSIVIFGEQFTSASAVGLVLIIAGVVLVHLGQPGEAGSASARGPVGR